MTDTKPGQGTWAWERRRAAGETLLSDDGVNPTAYVIDPETGCHLWQGSMSSNDTSPYASYRGSRMPVRRFVWEQIHGPLPSEFDVRANCENDRCINGEHLAAFNQHHQPGKRPGGLPREELARSLPRTRPFWLTPREWRIARSIVRDGLSIAQAAERERMSKPGAGIVFRRVERKIQQLREWCETATDD